MAVILRTEKDNREMKTFDGLAVSSKFAICGLPIRLDSYRTCSFGCEYCFANGRKIMGSDSTEIAVCNTKSIESRLRRVRSGYYDEDNFLDSLITQDITWHCGGMSDPFQPIERELGITHELIDITMKYGVSILFSTKSDTVYYANINPIFHSFQLSVTNIENRNDIEPNVPTIEKRFDFFRRLKKDGFRVGIRIQPFIPGVSGLDIIKEFESRGGADHYTIEGLKLVPQNEEQKEYLLKLLNLRSEQFTQMGLLNLKPEYRLRLYRPLIEYFEMHGISYSISDNDLRKYTNSACCCGDKLAHNATSFNTTSMIKAHPDGYNLDDVLNELQKENLDKCVCDSLFASNRTGWCKTVRDFYVERFKKASSPFSPNFQYMETPTLF